MQHRFLLTTLMLLSAGSANSPQVPTGKQPTTPTSSVVRAGAPVSAVGREENTGNARAFADKVWRVERSSTLEPGTTYTFLGNGTLVIDAPGGTPMTGSWRDDAGQLTMVEEGVAYPTDIVAIDAGHLVLRSHNPAGTVEIALVAAPEQALPKVSR